MNISISKRNNAFILEETESYIYSKTEKLQKFYNLQNLEIVMETKQNKYRVEIIAFPGMGRPIVAVGIAKLWFSAIDKASEKLESQLRKIKGKKTRRIKQRADEMTSNSELQEF